MVHIASIPLCIIDNLDKSIYYRSYVDRSLNLRTAFSTCEFTDLMHSYIERCRRYRLRDVD